MAFSVGELFCFLGSDWSDWSDGSDGSDGNSPGGGAVVPRIWFNEIILYNIA